MPLTGKDSKASSRYERDSFTFTREESKTSSRHNRCEKQLNCTVVTGKPSSTGSNISNPRHMCISTRSGWEVHRPLRLMIHV